jgi:hypothetical protein
MSEPLDLRSLADVESPDVVRAALRNFRRRTLLRSAMVALVAVALVAALIVGTRPSLADRIDSMGAYAPGEVHTFGDVSVTVVRVNDLGNDLGVHLLLAAPKATGADDYLLGVSSIKAQEAPESTRVFEVWYQVAVPADGRIEVSVQDGTGCGPAVKTACEETMKTVGTFTIDAKALYALASES